MLYLELMKVLEKMKIQDITMDLQLINIPKFSIVGSCIIGYMHLICEGVVLKIVNLWITGANKNSTKLHNNLIQVVNKILNYLAIYIPL